MFLDELKRQVLTRQIPYTVKRINLTNARSDELYEVSGNVLSILDSSSPGVTIQIKLNETRTDPIVIRPGDRIEGIFIRFYLTNTAQSGAWVDLIVGADNRIIKEQKFDLPQPITTAAGAMAGVSYTLAAAEAARVVVKAADTNLGYVWLNVDGAAVSGSNLELAPGDYISLQIRNVAQIRVLFDVAGDRVRVIRSV